MIKELQQSMENQILATKNYYHLLDSIVTTTDAFLNTKHSFSHPMAAVAWTWEHYDIWVTESVLTEDTDCIFTLVIFDTNDEEGKVHCGLDIIEVGNRFSARIITNNATDKKLLLYFKTIETLVKTFRGVEE